MDELGETLFSNATLAGDQDIRIDARLTRLARSTNPRMAGLNTPSAGSSSRSGGAGLALSILSTRGTFAVNEGASPVP
jgi:hypothetical protein